MPSGPLSASTLDPADNLSELCFQTSQRGSGAKQSKCYKVYDIALALQFKTPSHGDDDKKQENLPYFGSG